VSTLIGLIFQSLTAGLKAPCALIRRLTPRRRRYQRHGDAAKSCAKVSTHVNEHRKQEVEEYQYDLGHDRGPNEWPTHQSHPIRLAQELPGSALKGYTYLISTLLGAQLYRRAPDPVAISGSGGAPALQTVGMNLRLPQNGSAPSSDFALSLSFESPKGDFMAQP